MIKRLRSYLLVYYNKYIEGYSKVMLAQPREHASKNPNTERRGIHLRQVRHHQQSFSRLN